VPIDGVEGPPRVALLSIGNPGRVVRAVSGARSDMTKASVAVSADIAGSMPLAGNALHARGGDRGIAMRLRVVVCALVGCVTLTLWLASGEPAAASGWAIQAAPAVPGLTSGQLSAVSCTSRTVCTAVGSYTNKANIALPLVERWNGSTWRIQRTPHPAGAKATSFSGVSCTSRTACTAVGGYTNKANIALPLAERWNGSAWRIQRASHPAGARSASLSGVWCTSRTGCVAVGSYTNKVNSELALAERWNGANWSIQRTPHPAGAKRASLSGVSCTSRTACTAVGGFGKPFDPELQPIGGGVGGALERRPLDDPADPQPGRRDQRVAQRRVVHLADCVHRCRELHQALQPDGPVARGGVGGALGRRPLDDPGHPRSGWRDRPVAQRCGVHVEDRLRCRRELHQRRLHGAVAEATLER
jgi:hypothetical protein